MLTIQKLYENGTGNQCTLCNINTKCMADEEKKEEKNVGERGKGITTSYLCCALNVVESVLSCLA